MRLVPRLLRRHVDDRPQLRRVLANTSWLFADRVLRMGVGVVVAVWVARYLGAAQFGALSFATAFVALLGSAATLGLDGVAVRDLVRHPSRSAETLGTAFALRVLGGLTTVALSVAAIRLTRPDDPVAQSLVAVLSAATVFQAADVIDFWFQSHVASKYAVWAKNAAFLAAAAVRVALIRAGAPLVAFAWATLLEAVVAAVGLAVAYHARGERVRGWRVSRTRAAALVAESWPLLLSGMAIMVYMRIDVVMLAAMVGEAEAGIYSAATRVSEVWYFVPTAITSSVAPGIAAAKVADSALYYARLQRLFYAMTAVALLVAVPMTFGADRLTAILYGPGYAGAGPILAVHVWAAVFVALGVAQSPWDVNEGLMRLALARTVAGALANVALNLLLIPAYGGLGAAVATVASYALSAFVLNAVSARTRPIFRLQANALTFRHRATGGRGGAA